MQFEDWYWLRLSDLRSGFAAAGPALRCGRSRSLVGFKSLPAWKRRWLRCPLSIGQRSRGQVAPAGPHRRRLRFQARLRRTAGIFAVLAPVRAPCSARPGGWLHLRSILLLDSPSGDLVL